MSYNRFVLEELAISQLQLEFLLIYNNDKYKYRLNKQMNRDFNNFNGQHDAKEEWQTLVVM
jgi:hypothetical protein